MNKTIEEKQILKKRAIEDIAMWGRILSGFAFLIFLLTTVISCSIFVLPTDAGLEKGEAVFLILTMLIVAIITSPGIRINKTVNLAHEDLVAPENANEQEYVDKLPRSFKFFAQLGVKDDEDKALLLLIRYANILRYVGFTSSFVIGVFATFIFFMRFIRPLFL